MYKKGVVLELQFPGKRMVRTGTLQADSVGSTSPVSHDNTARSAIPTYALTLTPDEARALLDRLRQRLVKEDISAPFVLSLGEHDNHADTVQSKVAISRTPPRREGEAGGHPAATTHAAAAGAMLLAASASATTAAVAGTLDSPDVRHNEDVAFKQWVCVICGWIYDEEAGLPEEGIAPGTRFEDIPDDWRCPLCDVGKADFAVVAF